MPMKVPISLPNHALDDVIYAMVVPQGSSPQELSLFLAGSSRGLYRSEDQGHTWSYAYQELVGDSPVATPALVISPQFRQDRLVFAGISGAVLRSKDAGIHWRAASFPPPAPLVVALAISPDFAQDGILFAAAAEDGVFCSTDGGIHWGAWNFGLLDLNLLSLVISPDFAVDETIFAGTSTGLFRSTNGGRAWREVQLPIDYDAILSLAISPAFARDGLIFAGTENNGLLRSDDRGDTWVKVSAPHLQGPVNGILLSPEFPGDPTLISILANGVYLSRDGGLRWEPWLTDRLPASFVVTALAAPHGFNKGEPILIGGVGGVILLRLD